MNTEHATPSFREQVRQFLFAEEIPYALALLRMAMPLVLLQGVLARWRYCEELYSTNGVNISLMENFGSYNILQPLPPFWTACLMSILVLTLVTSIIGWHTRTSLIISLIAHTFFACNDTATSMTKFTVIATHVLLLLSVSECSRIWSIDSWLAGIRNPGRQPLSERPAWALVPVWPQRLLLFMIGITYLGAAITKLHMPEFITGEAISYWIMSNPNFRHYIGEWMTQYPGLLEFSGHFTMLWEVLFIFLTWQGFQRKYMFAMGLFFHVMAMLMLGEVTFLFIMSACYLGCMTERESCYFGAILCRMMSAVSRRVPVLTKLTKIGEWRMTSRIGRLSPQLQVAAFGSLLLIVGVGGAWANYRLDRYGVRRPEGPYALQPMDMSEVERLFAPSQRIREVDKFLNVKVGSVLISGRLFDSRDDFRYGNTFICEASLNPPHEDMWVEFHLMNSERKLIKHDGIVVARESKWAQFRYPLTEALEPGEYTLLVRSRGQEICSRSFTLEMGTKAPVAN